MFLWERLEEQACPFFGAFFFAAALFGSHIDAYREKPPRKKEHGRPQRHIERESAVVTHAFVYSDASGAHIFPSFIE